MTQKKSINFLFLYNLSLKILVSTVIRFAAVAALPFDETCMHQKPYPFQHHESLHKKKLEHMQSKFLKGVILYKPH